MSFRILSLIALPVTGSISATEGILSVVIDYWFCRWIASVLDENDGTVRKDGIHTIVKSVCRVSDTVLLQCHFLV